MPSPISKENRKVRSRRCQTRKRRLRRRERCAEGGPYLTGCPLHPAMRIPQDIRLRPHLSLQVVRNADGLPKRDRQRSGRSNGAAGDLLSRDRRHPRLACRRPKYPLTATQSQTPHTITPHRTPRRISFVRFLLPKRRATKVAARVVKVAKEREEKGRGR